MKFAVVAGQPSWQFASDKVEAAVTRAGGQLGPVQFRVGRKVVSPYSVAPWAEEPPTPGCPPMLNALRGDFFCAPFGGNDVAYRGEKHPAHGESANAEWQCESLDQGPDRTRLHLSLATAVRPGRMEKVLELRTGQSAIYCQHVVKGFSGVMNFGHHAMLKFPEQPFSGLISTSRIQYGMVAPLPVEEPANRGYSSLQPGALFRRLDRIPSAFGPTADLSRYPARRGYEDLVMFVHQAKKDFAWTAVTFPNEGFVYYALKDPRVLQSTIFWISNGGRHYPPWNGRHINVMGLEDVTSYFHYGLAQSARENEVTRAGFSTAFKLTEASPLIVNYIMGVAPVPRGFESVANIKAEDGGILLRDTKGGEVRTKVDVPFLYSDPAV